MSGRRDRDNREVWESLGREDPDWAVLTVPQHRHGGWLAEQDRFYGSGRADVAAALALLPVSPAGGQALDYGCGPGRLTFALRERYEAVTAVDVSAPMLTLLAARARERGLSGIETVHSGRLRPAADHDLVLSLLVLQHLPTRAAVARVLVMLAGCLRPDGHLLVEVPARARGWRQRLQPRYHAYRAARLAGVRPAALHRAGLSGISMLTLPDGWMAGALADAELEVLGRHERPGSDYTYARWVARRPVPGR